MTTRTARALLRPASWMACASLLALLLGGCTGSLLQSDAEAPDTFRLGVAAATDAATASTMPSPSALAIAVARPRAAAAIDTDRIAVHSAGNRFDYYSAARWAESAPQMLQQNLVSRAGRHGPVRRWCHDRPGTRADGTPARRGTATIRSRHDGCRCRILGCGTGGPRAGAGEPGRFASSRTRHELRQRSRRVRVRESIGRGRRGVRSRECTGGARYRCARAGCGGGIAGQTVVTTDACRGVLREQAQTLTQSSGRISAAGCRASARVPRDRR